MFERESNVANFSEIDLSKPKNIFCQNSNNPLSYAAFVALSDMTFGKKNYSSCKNDKELNMNIVSSLS
jgi:hypothetical protein